MIITHQGTVYPQYLGCKTEEVGVVWNLIKTDKYWLGEGGIHFNKQGDPMNPDHTQRLDVSTIYEV